MSSGKGVILSGMRPTGRLHLGNYLGALKNWVKLQDEYECFFLIADWHALMSEYERADRLRENSLDMLCVWLASGLDPERCVMFRQSDICQHLELFFILSALTPVSWLERCPTYKEAVENSSTKDIANYAFLGYPALQAADIALYRAGHVPVGVDQLPHLEFTREIVRRFNNFYGGDLIPEPEPVLTEVVKLSGTDSRKMSKSYGNTILITEEPKELSRKINSMVTDPGRARASDPGNPEICTVFEYHKIFSPEALPAVESACRNAERGCVACKKELGLNLEKLISPIREKYLYYKENSDKVTKILEEGNSRASSRARENMRIFRKAMRYE